MATIERGIGLVQRVIAELSKRPEGANVVGASPAALDALESKLMVELPPSLRTLRTGSAQTGQLSMNGPMGPYPQLGHVLATAKLRGEGFARGAAMYHPAADAATTHPFLSTASTARQPR